MKKTKDVLERVPKKKVERLAAVSLDELKTVAGGRSGCGRDTGCGRTYAARRSGNGRARYAYARSCDSPPPRPVVYDNYSCEY